MGKENGVMFQFFEWYLPADASLWKTVSSKAQELSDKGVTSVWLPPAYKGQAGINDTGYGVYDLYDLGEFDQKKTVPTKYGTKDEYIDAVNKLQACGIDVYADIVLNHRMGGLDQVHISRKERQVFRFCLGPHLLQRRRLRRAQG